MAKQPRILRLALFVEGANHSDIQGRDNLSSLWKSLCRLCGVPASASVYVVGFSKGHLRKMEHRPEIKDAGTQPLDRLVAQHYDKRKFDRAIIAFDALPENQEVVPKGCKHEEIDFVLRHFEASTHLPDHLRRAATSLRAHYAMDSSQRTPRKPRSLELLYMWPNFEGLLVSDESTVKRALIGYGNPTPAKWPAFTSTIHNPDRSILPKAVECASKEARDVVRGKFDTNKHGWAEYIVRHVRSNSKLLKHPIATRLTFIAGK